MPLKVISMILAQSQDDGSNARDRHNCGRLIVSLSVTAALLLGAFGIFLDSGHWIAGAPQKELDAVLIALLLSFGPISLLSIIERLLPAGGPRKSLNEWLLALQINVIFGITLSIGGALFGVGLKFLGGHFRLGLIDLRFTTGKDAVALGGAYLSSLVLGDFFYYWYHRSMHMVPFLWQLHKLHHMDEKLDAVTTGKQSWIEGFTMTFFTGLPAALLFKFTDITYYQAGLVGILITLVDSFYGPFFHTNIKLHFGKLCMLVNNPQMHRIHHSTLPHHRDKNFANYFPPWDLLFGTFYLPAQDEYPPTGVTEEKDVSSLLEAQLVTLRGWWRLLIARDSPAL